MEKFGLLVKLVAKPGMEAKLTKFLRGALPAVKTEKGTRNWYAFHIEGPIYGIFNTFSTEVERNTHLGGVVAQALMDQASELLLQPPTIEKISILASKSD